MTRYGWIVSTGIALLGGLALGTAIAQQGPPAAPAAPVPYFVGNRLGMPINPAADGAFTAMSNNVKVYGRCTRPKAAPTIRFAASSSCRIAEWDRTFAPTTPGSRF